MSAVQHVSSADGARIAYRASGNGDPMLLVHGSATSSADWLPVLPLLGERFTVVTMDRRGRGSSGDAPEYAIEREAEDVLAVLDAVGAELLVGHSYGALCSILAAAQTDRLRRLVIYEPPIAIRAERLRGLDRLVAEGEPGPALAGFLLEAGISNEQLATIRSSPAWPVLLQAVPALPRELRAGAAWRPPSAPLSIPTLILIGANTDSRVYLDGLDELQAVFQHARRELIAGQRHVAHVFAAPTFADLVTGFCDGADPVPGGAAASK